jgi:Mg2+ and Co2+ transporter CorA
MQATMFDGHSWRECTTTMASDASKDTSLSWIDLRLDGPDDPEAPAMFTALGIDPMSAVASLKAGLKTDFVIELDSIEGVAWLAGPTNMSPTQAHFTVNGRRLVTWRTGGDEAFAQVQKQLEVRAGLAIKQPSRMLGFMLQSMLTTVQQSLTDLLVRVGSLDMDIIAETTPSAAQSAQLAAYRQGLQDFATRFPGYVMNVNAALIDPDTITVMEASGVKELQNFATLAGSTQSMMMNVVDAIRSAAQDLQGQVATWQGNRINQLTVVTIVFLPITFLTGYFGMNFQWIDNLLTSASAYLIFGVLLPVGALLGSLLWLARRGFSLNLRAQRRERSLRHSSADSARGDGTGSA